MTQPPELSRCTCGSMYCGPVACRFTGLKKVALFTGMTHAQAQQVCREIGAVVKQDGRGRIRLVPTEPEAA